MKKSLINPLQNNLVGGNHTPDGNAGGGGGGWGHRVVLQIDLQGQVVKP